MGCAEGEGGGAGGGGGGGGGGGVMSTMLGCKINPDGKGVLNARQDGKCLIGQIILGPPCWVDRNTLVLSRLRQTR